MISSGNILKHTIRRAVGALPPGLRLLTDMTTGGISDMRANWRQQAYLVRGQLRAAAGEGTLIHFGQLPQYKSWIANFFSDVRGVQALGDFSLPEIALRKGPLAHGDALVCPTTPLSQAFFKARGWLVVPRYVKCVIDLRKPVERIICRHAAKDDLRIARKMNYSFKELRADTEFDEFYQEMLVPTSRTRHEERANISSLETLRGVFRRGYLLAAYRGSEWVGANLMVPHADGVLDWANVGWRGGSEQLMKDRLVSALMHEMIVRGKDQGFVTLDLGACNPFVNDGPLNYKLKWGAQMGLPLLGYEGTQLHGLNAFFSTHFDLASEGARSMLSHSPILDKSANRLRAIGWNSTIRPDFKHQIDDGLCWVDLAKAQDAAG